MAKLTIVLETTPTDRRTVNNLLAHLESDIFHFIKGRPRESVVTISSTRFGANYRMKVSLEQEGDHIGESVPDVLKYKEPVIPTLEELNQELHDVLERCKDLIHHGHTIQALQCYKEYMGCSLTQAIKALNVKLPS